MRFSFLVFLRFYFPLWSRLDISMRSLMSLIVLFLVNSCVSQVITVSEPIIMRNDIAYYLLGEQEGNVLLFRDQETKFEVFAYDEGMQQRWNKKIELDKGRPEIFDVIPTNDQFEVIYKYRKKGRVYAKIHRFDAAANLRDSATVKDLGSTFQNTKYEIKFSENKRKMLFIDFDRFSKFEAFVLDLDSMKVNWSFEFNSDDLLTLNEKEDVLIDNLGNAYLIFDRFNRKLNREDHRFEILAYGPSFNNLEKLALPLADFLTYDAIFQIDNLNRKLVIGGLYSQSTLARANGYFYLSTPLEMINDFVVAKHRFTDEQAATLIDKKIEDNDGVPNLNVRDVVLRRDGGLLLFVERIQENERFSGSMTNPDRYGSYTVDYFYDNVFVASIHSDGEAHWQDILHKRQFSQDDGAVYSSFYVMKTPTNLKVIYNDDIKNENLVSEYVISPGGAINRTSVFNTEKQDLKIRFRDAIQISSNELIAPSERKNRIKLVRVTY